MATQESGLKGRFVLAVRADKADLECFLAKFAPNKVFDYGAMVGDRQLIKVYDCTEVEAARIRESLVENLHRLGEIARERRLVEAAKLPT